MTTNLKALLVVLVMAMAVFHFAKPICLRYMTVEDFNRRRNIWAFLTITAFVSPSFWVYALFALPVMYKVGRKDSNPVALYLLLFHVIPPLHYPIPAVLVNEIFDLDNYRLLAFGLLVPVAWSLIAEKRSHNKSLALADFYLAAYLILQILLLAPYENITNTMRRGFLFFLDTTVLFYVICSICADRKKLVEAIAAFTLSCAIFVPVAVFEQFRSWLLYAGLVDVWGGGTLTSYLFRGDSLRAQASTGHSLVLGYFLALALVFWLFFSAGAYGAKRTIIGIVGVWAGLIAAFSRAPWITAILGVVIQTVHRPNGMRLLLKGMLWVLPAVLVLPAFPVGQQVLDSLPFVGTVDADNVIYRQQLAESSWERIKANPFFGDAFFLTHLEHLRQGQGIIDLVNVYASIAMLYGGVGLILFLAPFVLAMGVTFKRMKIVRKSDPALSNLGGAIFACLAATAFFMATGSFGTGLAKMFYILAALGIAYGQIPTDKLSR